MALNVGEATTRRVGGLHDRLGLGHLRVAPAEQACAKVDDVDHVFRARHRSASRRPARRRPVSATSAWDFLRRRQSCEPPQRRTENCSPMQSRSGGFPRPRPSGKAFIAPRRTNAAAGNALRRNPSRNLARRSQSRPAPPVLRRNGKDTDVSSWPSSRGRFAFVTGCAAHASDGGALRAVARPEPRG